MPNDIGPSLGLLDFSIRWKQSAADAAAAAARGQELQNSADNASKNTDTIIALLAGNIPVQYYAGPNLPAGGITQEVINANKNSASAYNALTSGANSLGNIMGAINFEPTAASDAVWAYLVSGLFGNNEALYSIMLSGVMAATMDFQGLIMSLTNPNIQINIEGLDPSGSLPPIAAFALADPANKLDEDETDVEMLRRLYPANGWSQGYFGGSHYCGCEIVGSDGSVVNYVYVPRGPSLSEFYHLWDYMPSSGPPLRNGIKDFMSILTLLPLQW